MPKKSKKLTAKQKSRLAEKIMDWGNHFFVGTVITQFFSERSNIFALLAGVFIWVATFYIGTNIK